MASLAEALASELKRIKLERGLTVAAAARALGVSRQAFHSYLNASAVPRQKTLQRAVAMWGIKIKVGDVTFDETSFPKSPLKIVEPIGQQLSLNLLETLDKVTQDDLKFGVKKVGKTLRLVMSVEIPA